MKATAICVAPLLLAVLVCGCHRGSSSPSGKVLPRSVPLAVHSATPVTSAVVNGVVTNQPKSNGTTPGVLKGTVPPRNGHAVPADIDVRDGYGRLVSRSTTDGQGSFELNLPPGTYYVSSHSRGDLHTVKETIDIGPGEGRTLVLHRPDR